MSITEANLSNHDFAEIWNDVQRYPQVIDVARKIEYSVSGTKKRAHRLRRARAEGERVPFIIDRSAHGQDEPLLPETQNRFAEEMTEGELVEELRRIYLRDPDTNITRLRFRKETGLSDSTWNRYFGTFQEFKRQAGIEMTRQQHQVERQLAKHVAVDHYRAFNERHDYEDRYLKPTGRKIKTIIGCSDLHDIECDPFYLRVLIETCRIVQPDVVNFGGDIFDLAEFGKYSVDPREWDVVGRIKWVHKNIFEPIREVCPDAQIDFIEGNHEFRLLRHMADATPALKSILSDLLGLTVSDLLGLEDYEINYIAKGDLSAYNKGEQKKEVGKSYKIYDDALLIHHHPHARHWGLPGWNGHHHNWQVFHIKNALRGAYSWMQLGCGHKLDAAYCEGEFWNQGFNVCHLNTQTKAVNHEYINVTDMAVVGGLYFTREPTECVGAFA